MDRQLIERRKRRRGGAALALAALAGLALLLAWTASGGAPDPMALAQEGATSTSTSAPRPPSPHHTAHQRLRRLRRPTPQPIRFITNPTEAYVLGQRYYQGERPKGAAKARPHRICLPLQERPSSNALCFFPWSAPMAIGCGTKGTGKAHSSSERLHRQLGGSWWYDWQHDYTWGNHGNFAYRHFVPMVWSADLPGEPGVPLAPPGDSDNG